MDIFPDPSHRPGCCCTQWRCWGPRVNASLLPVFTSGSPPTEIARLPSAVCLVALVLVDVGLVSAHPPSPEDRRAGPSYGVRGPDSEVPPGGVSHRLVSCRVRL